MNPAIRTRINRIAVLTVLCVAAFICPAAISDVKLIVQAREIRTILKGDVRFSKLIVEPSFAKVNCVLVTGALEKRSDMERLIEELEFKSVLIHVEVNIDKEILKVELRPQLDGTVEPSAEKTSGQSDAP